MTNNSPSLNSNRGTNFEHGPVLNHGPMSLNHGLNNPSNPQHGHQIANQNSPKVPKLRPNIGPNLGSKPLRSCSFSVKAATLQSQHSRPNRKNYLILNLKNQCFSINLHEVN